MKQKNLKSNKGWIAAKDPSADALSFMASTLSYPKKDIELDKSSVSFIF